MDHLQPEHLIPHGAVGVAGGAFRRAGDDPPEGGPGREGRGQGDAVTLFGHQVLCRLEPHPRLGGEDQVFRGVLHEGRHVLEGEGEAGPVWFR